MSAVDDAKAAQRAAMRRLRAAIPDRDDRAALLWGSALTICRSLQARTVMAFVGVGSEPETASLLRSLLGDGVRVVLPRVEGSQIVAVAHSADSRFEPGPLGIPSPIGPSVDPLTIDVVLVPGLAFTADGRRLGQGGGYYDRFLPLLRPGCITIGVCFSEQVVDDVVTEAHDRNVDRVLTDAARE